MRTQTIKTELRPLNEQPYQVYLGMGVHTLGLLAWILEQTGPAKVLVTTFSTSDEFLSGFLNLRKKGLIIGASLLADLKASKKTVKLEELMSQCFEKVYLGNNHSKLLLVMNDKWQVSVISSQNNTYGGRNECTFITTDEDIHTKLCGKLYNIQKDSVKIDGLHTGTTEENRATGSHAHSSLGNFRPFGVEE
jgi:hypothetical protein